MSNLRLWRRRRVSNGVVSRREAEAEKQDERRESKGGDWISLSNDHLDAAKTNLLLSLKLTFALLFSFRISLFFSLNLFPRKSAGS